MSARVSMCCMGFLQQYRFSFQNWYELLQAGRRTACACMSHYYLPLDAKVRTRLLACLLIVGERKQTLPLWQRGR